jgi:hypothetical protein
MVKIILSTCWYILKAKFDPTVYQSWIHNMLSNVNNYHLVIYCDKVSYQHIEPYLRNPRIKAVIKPPEKFSTYHLKDQWINNHSRNILLKDKVDWQLNMLWSEKIHFVCETIRAGYFDGSDWYGWCDIGYFRGRLVDSPTSELLNWPNDEAVESLDKSKIYYACVNNNMEYIKPLSQMILDRNSEGLPRFPIPDNQISIAGGFFLGTLENLEWWHDVYYNLLDRYFTNNRLVKDDQIIVADGVFTHLDRFSLCGENDPRYDNWFLFQRYLLL